MPQEPVGPPTDDDEVIVVEVPKDNKPEVITPRKPEQK